MTRQQLEKVKTSSTPKPTTKPTSNSRKHPITTATRPGKRTPAPVLKPTKPVLTQITVFICTNALQKHDTKTKSKLNKRTTETSGIKKKGKNTKKGNPCTCIHKYCLQPLLVEIKHLIKKILTSYSFRGLSNLCEPLIYRITCIKII